MFASLNLTTLTNKVRLLSDKRASNFVNDEEIQGLLADSFDMLFMKIADLDENYFLKTSDILDAQNGEIALPQDLYQLRLLERVSGDYSFPIYQKTLAEVSGISNPYWNYSGEAVPYGFVLFSDKLKIYPLDSAQGYRFRLSYTRDPMALGDEKLQKGWEKALSYKVAYSVTVIQQDPNANLADLAKQWEDLVVKFASNRNKGPRVIADLERHSAYHGTWL